MKCRTTHGNWNALRGIGYAEVRKSGLVLTRSFPPTFAVECPPMLVAANPPTSRLLSTYSKSLFGGTWAQCLPPFRYNAISCHILATSRLTTTYSHTNKVNYRASHGTLKAKTPKLFAGYEKGRLHTKPDRITLSRPEETIPKWRLVSLRFTSFSRLPFIFSYTL